MHLPCKRADFDIPADITYLNCAYMGPLSHRVLRAGIDGFARKCQPWKITQEDFFLTIDKVRQRFAQLVGGDGDGVALLPSVSYGIATAANNVAISRGEEILVLAEQFPSNVYAWEDLAQRSGALLRTVPSPQNDDWTGRIVDSISKRTAIVAVPNCHWTDGSPIDLVLVGKRARAVDATLVVDGSQSIGALDLQVDQIEADFVITGTYKWLLGPYSQALMWVSPRYRRGRPLEHNWISRANSRDFAELVEYTDEFDRGARRYDVGEVSNFGLVPASLAALEQTLDWTVDAIGATLRRLVERLAEEAMRIGLGVSGGENRSRHMIGLRLLGRDPRSLMRRLSEAKVFVSLRGDSIRVAPHVYNRVSDIDRLLGLLEEFVATASSVGSSATLQ